MSFLRFVLAERHPDSGVEDGLFRTAYALQDDPAIATEDRRELKECLEWFDKHVHVRDRFNRSKSKGYYRRATRGISWFRDSAEDCVATMHRMKSVLERNGYHVTMLCEARPGYVVYEDEWQVVADPFRETSTGP